MLVSIHDVMPSTRTAVSGLLEWLEERQIGPAVLLVVPGAGWAADGIRWLRSLEAAGHELAGHGWRHRIERFRGVRHRVHGALFSRRVAEHLALDRAAVARLVARCHAWFGEAGLRSPRLYVPPAWAMGPLDLAGFTDLPFAAYEDLTGFRLAGGARLRVPVVGFEADRPWTIPFLRAFNGMASGRAGRAGLLRIAIHPRDLDLPMARDLAGLLDRYAAMGADASGPRFLSDVLAAGARVMPGSRKPQAGGAEGSAAWSLSSAAGVSRASIVKPRNP